jgi:hypothetical protein
MSTQTKGHAAPHGLLLYGFTEALLDDAALISIDQAV